MKTIPRNLLLALLVALVPACGGGGGGGGTSAPLPPWTGLGMSSWGVDNSVPVLAGSAHGAGVNNYLGDARHPKVVLGAAGAPFVAWDDSLQGIFLRAWDGTQWAELAGSGSGTGILPAAAYATVPSLALTPDNRPVIAWQEQVTGAGAPFEIKLLQWSGSSWDALGGTPIVSGLDGTSEWPSVAVDSSGYPVVVWDDDINITTIPPRVYLKRWTGTAWVEVGGSATGFGISGSSSSGSHCVVALDAAGNPTVAWSPGGAGACLRRWDPTGPAWVELGGSGTASGLSAGTGDYPSLTLDGAGNPTLCWQEGPDGSAVIYLKRWTGSAWIELGGSGSGGGVTGSGTGLCAPPSPRTLRGIRSSSTRTAEASPRAWFMRGTGPERPGRIGVRSREAGTRGTPPSGPPRSPSERAARRPWSGAISRIFISGITMDRAGVSSGSPAPMPEA